MKASLSIIIAFIIINALLSFTTSQNTDSCGSNLNLNNQIPFDITSPTCLPAAWNSQGFILRYAQGASNTWSFVLSAPDTNSYVAIGFSNDGSMVGSSAVVGWIDDNGVGNAKQYFLGGKVPTQVVVDQGNLTLVDNSTTIVSQSSRLYLAFQLQAMQPSTGVLYAVGPRGVKPAAPSYSLAQHIDMTSTTLNYVTGQANQEGSPYTRLRKAHGILNMIGWGILMLIGVIAARYFKQHDPLWFYSHIAVQAVGFTLGLVGIICGFVLEDRLGADVDTHKALGIIILVLACLQVMALLARPEKGSKYRKYWNWYHRSGGSLVIIFAIANVFYGIHLGGEGKSWNAGYGVVIGLLFGIAIVLEVRMWMRR